MLLRKRVKIEEHLINNEEKTKFTITTTFELLNLSLFNDRIYSNVMISVLKKLRKLTKNFASIKIIRQERVNHNTFVN